jgi:hypothetical protein
MPCKPFFQQPEANVAAIAKNRTDHHSLGVQGVYNHLHLFLEDKP